MRAPCVILITALFFTCTVPTLKDEERVRPRACNNDHPCTSGYVCMGNVCVPEGSGGECTPEAREPCGPTGGECVQGSRVCGSDFKWGACVGSIGPVAEVCDTKDNDCNGASDDNLVGAPACPLTQGVCATKKKKCDGGMYEPSCGGSYSYGPDYEPTETKCDGQDNDCDGQTDEVPPQMCPLQLGVCSGATAACSQVRALDGGCPASAYVARSTSYEIFETSCDGNDNDCDGNTDTWPLQNISNSGTVISIRPAAVKLASGSVLVMWQEANKVLARKVGTDGTLSATTEPSVTAENSARVTAPALASDGQVNWGIWIEEQTIGGAKRVQAAPLSDLGRSTLGAAGALQIASTDATQVAIGVDGPANRALAAVVNAGNLDLIAFASNAQGSVNTAVRPGTDPQVAPAGGGFFWVTYLKGGGSTLCLADTGPTGIPLVCSAVSTGAKSLTPFPLNGAAPFLSTVGALSVQDAGQRPQFFECDGGSCIAGPLAPSAQQLSALAAGLKFAAVARNQRPVFGAYEEGSKSYRLPSDGGAPVELNGSLSLYRRPVPLMLGPGRGAVVFDTEGNTGGNVGADEIVIQRLCAP